MIHGCQAPAIATAARAPASMTSAAIVTFSTVRRSTRSVIGPATRGNTRIGTEKHRPSRPSANAEWVSRYRTHSLATLLIWVPTLDTMEPAHSRTKDGSRRAAGSRPFTVAASERPRTPRPASGPAPGGRAAPPAPPADPCPLIMAWPRSRPAPDGPDCCHGRQQADAAAEHRGRMPAARRGRRGLRVHRPAGGPRGRRRAGAGARRRGGPLRAERRRGRQAGPLAAG